MDGFIIGIILLTVVRALEWDAYFSLIEDSFQSSSENYAQKPGTVITVLYRTFVQSCVEGFSMVGVCWKIKPMLGLW